MGGPVILLSQLNLSSKCTHVLLFGIVGRIMSKSFKNALRVAELCAKGTPPFARETIHLCNWYVTLVRPSKELPEDQFQCKVPMV